MAPERGTFQPRGRGGRGRGRGGSSGSRSNNDSQRSQDNGYGARAERTGYDPIMAAPQSQGSFVCDYFDPNPPSSSQNVGNDPYQCSFKCHTANQLMLHKADRHLIYPAGGLQELKRHDPMLVAEEKERLRRQRQNDRSRARVSHPLPSKPGSSASQMYASTAGQDDDNDDETAAQHGRVFDGPPDATIAGLNIQLDSPELIAEWINQRKKRWPTRQVVEEKMKQKEERQKRSELVFGTKISGVKRPRGTNDTQSQSMQPRSNKAAKTPAQTKEIPEHHESDSDGSPEEVNTTSVRQLETLSVDDAESSDDDDSSTGVMKPDTDAESDSDSAPEEASSKTPVAPMSKDDSIGVDRRPICKHFLQGRCSFGDRCRKRHTASSTADHPSPQAQKQRRPQPRPAPVNPFDQPDLLRQLLRNEIDKHVDAVGQAIRFIVENDMLLHVETEEGQAVAQRAKRNLVQVVSSSEEVDGQQTGQKADDALAEPAVGEPLVEGGLAVARPDSDSADSTSQPRLSLFRPKSPELRPLSELQYPPEPDPLIFLDPLRRDDPKPLLPAQLMRIAKDTVIRSVLTPSSLAHPNGEKLKGLERAIVSLDALPSEFHRNAALEMILGVSGGNPTAGGAAGLVVKSRDGRRKISESDLFRMGLRVGGDEILSIKKLADRLTFLLDTTLQLDQADTQDWGVLDAEQRDQMRRQHFAKEADRLERLHKLGIDV